MYDVTQQVNMKYLVMHVVKHPYILLYKTFDAPSLKECFGYLTSVFSTLKKNHIITNSIYRVIW